MADIALQKNQSGIYDISFTNGDFTLDDGFTTAIQMSLYEEVRANESEVFRSELRRGWWGNTLQDVENYEQGSKLWLFDQSRANQQTANKAVSVVEDGFAWMIEDSLIKSVAVTASFDNSNLNFQVDLQRNNNDIDTRFFELWENTEEGSI